MTTGERIKKARIDRGLTQDDLAKALRTTKAAVSRYELNQRQSLNWRVLLPKNGKSWKGFLKSHPNLKSVSWPVSIYLKVMPGLPRP